MKRNIARLLTQHCGSGLHRRSAAPSPPQRSLSVISPPITTSRKESQIATRPALLLTDCDLAFVNGMRDVPTGNLQQLQRLLGLDDELQLARDLQDAVLLCFDCEAYESDQSKVTEVGVSFVDTRHIRSVSAGANAEAWLPFIHSSHYRIEEYRHLRNGRFSKGDPDSFAFGESAGLRLADASAVLSSVIENGGLAEKPSEPRNVVIVGHALSHDLAYLRLLGGLEVLEIPNVVLRLDTQSIVTPKKQKPGLGKLLTALEIEAKYLHNAGNDAHYTLYALLCMAVKERNSPGSVLASIPESTRPPKKRYVQRKKVAQPSRDSDTVAGHQSSSRARAVAGTDARGDDHGT